MEILLHYFYEIELYKNPRDIDAIEMCLNNIHEMVGDSIDYLFERAKQYMVDGKYQKAIEYYEKCLEIDDEIYDVWFGLGNAHNYLNDDKSSFYFYIANRCTFNFELAGPNLLKKEYLDYIDEIN